MSFTNYEICPLMSTATDKAPCSSRCAWYDDELAECAISRINGNKNGYKILVKNFLIAASNFRSSYPICIIIWCINF